MEEIKTLNFADICGFIANVEAFVSAIHIILNDDVVTYRYEDEELIVIESLHDQIHLFGTRWNPMISGKQGILRKDNYE